MHLRHPDRQVDLLLVGGSVCRTAKEKLLQAGISLAVQVKEPVLRCLARSCRTAVLQSPAQVLGATPEAQRTFMDQLTSAADERFPNLRAVAGVWPDVDGDQVFAFAIDRVLDGIAALAAEG